MLSLPPITIKTKQGSTQLLLPCPALDLIELVGSTTDGHLAIFRLLKSSPSLLLYFAAAHWSGVGTRPRSLKRLAAWTNSSFLTQLDGLEAGWSQAGSGKRVKAGKRAALVRLLGRASTQQDRVQLLTRWLRLTGKLKQSEAKCWLKTVLGNKLIKQACRFKKTELRMLRGAEARWSEVALEHVDVEWLIRWRQKFEQSEAYFEQRLLVEKLESMKQLAYGASHEINNPLANISTRAQTLLNDETDPERRQKLAVIYEQALRAHEMISDMMLFAKPPQPEFEKTNLRLFVGRLVKEFSPELALESPIGLVIARQPIELEVRIGAEIQDADLDVTQIAVALKVLIRNSIEAIGSAGRDGKIEVRAYRSQPGWIAFSVTDNGTGIPESIRPNLFDPFFSGREAGRGLGFGLSKAWRIAQLHRGDLQLDVGLDDGARFILSIPQQQSRVARIDNVSAA